MATVTLSNGKQIGLTKSLPCGKRFEINGMLLPNAQNAMEHLGNNCRVWAKELVENLRCPPLKFCIQKVLVQSGTVQYSKWQITGTTLEQDPNLRHDEERLSYMLMSLACILGKAVGCPNISCTLGDNDVLISNEDFIEVSKIATLRAMLWNQSTASAK